MIISIQSRSRQTATGFTDQVRRIKLASGVDEHLGELEVAVLSGQVERDELVRVHRVHLGPVLDEKLGNLRADVRGRSEKIFKGSTGL